MKNIKKWFLLSLLICCSQSFSAVVNTTTDAVTPSPNAITQPPNSMPSIQTPYSNNSVPKKLRAKPVPTQHKTQTRSFNNGPNFK
jgi:hypothetical protein